MDDNSQRINSPIPTAELERRWNAVRAAMEREHIDALVMQNRDDYMGGYVKYFSDQPATNGYPLTVIFPRDDGMTIINQGPFGAERDLPAGGDGLYRGVRRVMHTPSYVSAHFTAGYDAELAARALKPYARGAIGLVGSFSIGHAFAENLKRELSGAKFVEASELVDRIKAVKSADELELIRKTALMQDAALEAAFSAIEPGRTEMEIGAVAERVSHQLGSEQGLYLSASGPIGTPAFPNGRHTQNRVLRKGDHYTLLVENSGAGGFYTEIARTCVIGKATDEMRDEVAFATEARNFTLGMLRPGASCKDIWESFNRFMRENGKPEEGRLYCHSQGYDLVERPLVRFDEPMPLAANMVLACHPTYFTRSATVWICDDYLVGNGAPERLHRFPEKIVELG